VESVTVLILSDLTSLSPVRLTGVRGMQFVEALRYKPEGRRFDSLWGHWDFSLINSLRPLLSPGVDSGLTKLNTRDISWG